MAGGLLAVLPLGAPAADVNLTADHAPGEDWNTAAKWSDNSPPASGNDYFTLGFLLKTPTVNSPAQNFAGDSLTISPGGTLELNTPHSGTAAPGTFTSAGIVIFAGGTLTGTSFGGGNVQWLGGNPNFTASTLVDLSHGDRVRIGWVGGSWTGGGDITMTGNDPATNSNDLLFLSGVNGSAHTGNWFVTESRLIVAGGNNLGDSSRVTLGLRGGLDVRTNSTETIGSLASAETSSRVRNGQGGTFGILRTGGDNSDTTFAGIIENGSGTIGLVKQGSGTFTLTNTGNSYTGPTRVEGGLLRIAPTGGGMNFGSDVELAGGDVAFSSGGGVNFARNISGSGNFTLEGGSTFYRFSGNNSFSGDILIQGRLRVGSSTSLGDTGNAVTMESGSFLDLNRWTTEIGSLSGVGTVRNEADTGAGTDTSPRIITGGNHQSTTFGGVIVNGGGGNPVGLTKRGSGTFTLTNSGNSYSGETRVEGGTLLIQQSGRISNNSNVVISAGATLELRTSDWLYTGTISGAGGLTKSGDFGDNRLTGTNTYTGPTLVTGTGILRAGSNQAFGDNSALTVEGPAIVELNGWSNAVGSISGNGIIRNQPGANGPGSNNPTVLTTGGDDTSTSFSGVLVNGTGGVPLGLTKVGTGTLSLTSNANTYTGPTRVEGGLMRIAPTATGMNFGSNIVLDGGDVAFSSPGGINFARNISGNGNVTVEGGATFYRFSGTNSFTGNLLVEGRLRVGNATSLGNPANPLTVAAGGFLDLNGHSTEVGSLAGAGTVRNQRSGSGPGNHNPTVFTIGGNHADTEFSGTIANGSGDGNTNFPVALTKVGDGTQTLSGSSTYSGETRVEGGTLNVTGSITNTSAVLVINDGRLAGDGTIVTTGNSTTIQSGGTISPGDASLLGTGTMLLDTSSLTFDPGSLWEVNLAGIAHGRLQLDSPSTLALDNVSLVAGTGSFDFSADGTTPYWILDAIGAGGISGSFANMVGTSPAANLFPTADGFVDLDGTSFAVFLNAAIDGGGQLTQGSGVVLFATPEPGRALLLAAAGLVLLGHRRR